MGGPAGAAALGRRAHESVTAARAEVLGVSHALHAAPETAWREHASATLLTDHLQSLGMSVSRGVADLPTAFTATAGGGGATSPSWRSTTRSRVWGTRAGTTSSPPPPSAPRTGCCRCSTISTSVST
ncbi:hypothetical protein [Litorihabitans aurantiacus]|uniref:Uncharacterized protein n=1 Tax=Litorihabitans aurantiacus TaxID=1930061 RepID=A0AA37XFQ4_9MICO|nr:hypothetical protein [Litorihabitans aurantiacus]GMA32563.1 hypothetical protein GCM10025875_25550 [Litorihabitans aurantiacus]